MKKALIIIGVCLVAGYIIFSIFYFKDERNDDVCVDFDVVVKQEAKKPNYLDASEIKKYVVSQGFDPQGKVIGDVDLAALEGVLLSNKLIKVAEVYATGNGSIKAVITERKPVLRVIPDSGNSYYVDDEGAKIPLSRSITAYLPLATGFVKDEFAQGDLYKFALFLQSNEFWNAQIEQIVVEPNSDIRLIPRVGDHEVVLGKLVDYEEKLDKLLTFYKKELNEKGWNKYSVINLKYDKQVVCTKR